jgi:hypothetical protein
MDDSEKSKSQDFTIRLGTFVAFTRAFVTPRPEGTSQIKNLQWYTFRAQYRVSSTSGSIESTSNS